MSFWEKIAAAQASLRSVEKRDQNAQQGYAYTSAKDVQLAVTKALAEHGLLVMSSESAIESIDEITTRNGAVMQRVIVKARVVIGDGESSICGEGFGAGTDTLDKAPMKASTAAYKYALCAALNIAMGDDPEASAPDQSPLEPGLVWFGKHRGAKLSDASLPFLKHYFEVARKHNAPAEHFKQITNCIEKAEKDKK